MTRAYPLKILIIGAAYSLLLGSLRGAETSLPPKAHLDSFIESWDETAWLQKSFRMPAGYMRPLEDAGWKARLLAMRGLISKGKPSVGVLVDALKSGEATVRIFAAQTLGYLAPDVPPDPLLRAAQQDDDPAVRLYAVDSLGMQGAAGSSVDWDALLKAEQNRDVQKHIRYAMERKGSKLDPGVVKRLSDWNPTTIDTARVGKPAPDFELAAATGETIRLSDFRGKKPVVLVFVYGDT